MITSCVYYVCLTLCCLSLYWPFGDDKITCYPHVDRCPTWWTSSNGTFSALLAICAGNSPVTSEVPSQRPVTQSIDVFFDLCLYKRLSKQSRSWWLETPLRSLWRNCYERTISYTIGIVFFCNTSWHWIVWRVACFTHVTSASTTISIWVCPLKHDMVVMAVAQSCMYHPPFVNSSTYAKYGFLKAVKGTDKIWRIWIKLTSTETTAKPNQVYIIVQCTLVSISLSIDVALALSRALLSQNHLISCRFRVVTNARILWISSRWNIVHRNDHTFCFNDMISNLCLHEISSVVT